MKKLLLLLAVFTFSFGNAQTGMLNGTGYAPDISVTDLNGNSHNLYSYLNSGKIGLRSSLSIGDITRGNIYELTIF